MGRPRRSKMGPPIPFGLDRRDREDRRVGDVRGGALREGSAVPYSSAVDSMRGHEASRLDDLVFDLDLPAPRREHILAIARRRSSGRFM